MSDTIGNVGARIASMPNNVIAKYTPLGLCVNLAALLAIFGLCWFTILRHPAGTMALEHAWATDKRMVIVTFVYTPLAVWAISSVLRQVMYHGGRAIWIENGNLNYLAYGTASFSSLPLAGIQDVSIRRGFFLRPVRIAIHAKDRVDYIVPLFLSASAEEIRARLAEALGLERSPTAAKTL